MGHLQELDEGERLEELQDPGIDWESAVLQEESNSTVVVPEVECPLDEETLEGLQRTINPLEHSEYTKLVCNQPKVFIIKIGQRILGVFALEQKVPVCCAY